VTCSILQRLMLSRFCRLHDHLTTLVGLLEVNFYLCQGGYVFAGFCLCVCQKDNSKSYGWIFLKFWGYVGHGINYQWFNFGRDPAGILNSGSLWNFRYHCVKGGITEPLAKRRWWRHLANSFALAEVPAGYDCFLVPIGLHSTTTMQPISPCTC